MRHRIAKNKLGRTSSHRSAMFRNMAARLFQHGRVVTTEAKAKAVRPFAERLITMAKKKDLARYRRIIARLQDETVAKKLFDEIAPLYENRPGGYTRIIKLPENRLGDNTPRVIFELVGYSLEDKKVVAEEAPAGTKKTGKRREKVKKKHKTKDESAQGRKDEVAGDVGEQSGDENKPETPPEENAGQEKDMSKGEDTASA